jgi:hypothetical protein
MIHVRPLDERERTELKRLARREVGRVSERIRMILLSSKGYSVPQIADIFECDAASVRSWIERFEAEGVKGLYDHPRACYELWQLKLIKLGYEQKSIPQRCE